MLPSSGQWFSSGNKSTTFKQRIIELNVQLHKCLFSVSISNIGIFLMILSSILKFQYKCISCIAIVGQWLLILLCITFLHFCIYLIVKIMPQSTYMLFSCRFHIESLSHSVWQHVLTLGYVVTQGPYVHNASFFQV